LGNENIEQLQAEPLYLVWWPNLCFCLVKRLAASPEAAASSLSFNFQLNLL
jgi:hypothetical protein